MNEYDFENVGIDRMYCDQLSTAVIMFVNSLMYLNARSLIPKICEIKSIINLTEFPAVLMLTETWLSLNSVIPNTDNYAFISSPRKQGRVGGMGMFVRN
jgi:hypothetical protein